MFQSNQTYTERTFEGIKSQSQDFVEIEFEGCTFSTCDLSNTTFTNCKFMDCNFIDCNLSLLAVNGSSFIDVSFSSCKLIGINWTYAEWPQYQLSCPLTFKKGCNLTDSSFWGLSLDGVEITNSNLRSVDFRESSLVNAILTENDFSGAHFSKTALKGADLSASRNLIINIFENDLENATFSKLEALALLDALNINVVD